MNIGILALQGGFQKHYDAIKALGYNPLYLKNAQDFSKNLDGLILPGGESTTQLKLINEGGLFEPINEFVLSKKPLLATCAGLILCAANVINPSQKSFGWININIKRNAYGAQLESFEAISDIYKYHLIFIRAPQIIEISNPVKVVDTYKNQPILVRQNNVWGATFHPELSSDLSLYKLIFKK